MDMDYLQNTNGFHYSVLNINGKRKCFVIVKEINLSITKHLTFLFRLIRMQLGRNVLARSLLELATSLLGVSRLRREKLLAFRKLSAGSHSNS